MPSTVTGMRGMVSATLTLHGPGIDLHSGVFGGAVPNPATALARLVGALHDDQGRVQVPGFYDDVLELTDTERELFARVPADDAEFLEVAQSRALHGEAGFSTLERIGARPTAEVNGMGGGYQGAGHKTIVPTHAFAKLSFRLVADQDPAKIVAGVERFVAEHTPDGIEAELEWEGSGVRPCLVPLGTPAYTALTEAISAAFDGADVLPTREGGSGPEAALQAATGVPLVFLGFMLPGRPDPRAEREGVGAVAVHRRRGRRAPVVRVRPHRRHGAAGGMTVAPSRIRLARRVAALAAVTALAAGCSNSSGSPFGLATNAASSSSAASSSGGASSSVERHFPPEESTSPASSSPSGSASTAPTYSCPQVDYQLAHLRFDCIDSGLSFSTNKPIWPLIGAKEVEPSTHWSFEEGADDFGDLGSQTLGAIPAAPAPAWSTSASTA